jgi:hypothetical protein
MSGEVQALPMEFGEPLNFPEPNRPVNAAEILARLSPAEIAALLHRLEDVGVLEAGRADAVLGA